MTKRVAFDFGKAIPAAWDLLWKRHYEERAKGGDFRGNTYYVTARDVEQTVRGFAKDTLDGKPWGTNYYGYPTGIRVQGNLQALVRDWLLHNPAISGHNFDRGHISGMRFRPVGEPISPAEEKTLAAKAERKANPRPRLRHYNAQAMRGTALCQQARLAGRFRMTRPLTWSTNKPSEVTCKQCLNLLAKKEAA